MFLLIHTYSKFNLWISPNGYELVGKTVTNVVIERTERVERVKFKIKLSKNELKRHKA